MADIRSLFLPRYGDGDGGGDGVCVVCVWGLCVLFACWHLLLQGVKLAMDHLGVTEAVFIGDTPDDINAAVAAGVVGLGVCAPAAVNKEATSKLLMDCGASEVLSIGEEEQCTHFPLLSSPSFSFFIGWLVLFIRLLIS